MKIIIKSVIHVKNENAMVKIQKLVDKLFTNLLEQIEVKVGSSYTMKTKNDYGNNMNTIRG